jgi:hypothetical protein
MKAKELQGIQMTNEEMFEQLLARISNLETKMMQKFAHIEGKLNVIETKVDNVYRVCQIDEFDDRLKKNYGIQDVPTV